MERLQIQAAYMRLKPLCVSLMNQPSFPIVNEFIECVNNISGAVIQDLLEHVLYAAIVHLQSNKVSKDLKERLVLLVRKVIAKARIENIECFNRLFVSLVHELYDKNEPTMVIRYHEEFKETTILCIGTMMHRAFTEVIESFYMREHAPKLSQAIYICISIAKNEKSPSLRLAALETIMTLCQVDDESDRTDIILQTHVADVIMLILPGIASGLLAVALRSDIQNHKITMLALRVWGRITALVMQDMCETEQPPTSLDSLKEMKLDNFKDPMENILHDKGRKGAQELLKTVKRDQAWFNAIAPKLNILVEEMAVFKCNLHYTVRKELAIVINSLLTSCSRNMRPSVVQLVEYLLTLAEDDNEDVKNEAKIALSNINVYYTTNDNMRPLIILLEESFYNMLTQLPGIIRRSDSAEQLSCLNQIAGYLQLFGKRLPNITSSAAHLRRLLLALIYIIEVDSSSVTLLEEMRIKDIEGSTYFYKQHGWREFKFIHATACEAKIISICHLLAQHGGLRILTDNIFQLMTQTPRYRKECILLVNWIMNAPIEDKSFFSISKEAIDIYIAHDIWYPVISITDDVSLQIAQSNIIQCCLLLEGLGLIALKLKHKYERFLLKTLYLIMERAGSGHGLLSFIGMQSLENIAKSQQYQHIHELLQANLDYLSYHVTMKLRRVERNPGVLDVVEVVMKYSTISVMPCLKKIVEDVLSQLNAKFQKQNLYAFLKLFYTFVISINKLQDNEQKKEKLKNDNEFTEDLSSQSNRVIQCLLNHYEVKRFSENIYDDNVIETASSAHYTINDRQKTEDYGSEDVNEDEDSNDVRNFDGNTENTITNQTTDMSIEDQEKINNSSSKLPVSLEMLEAIMKHCLNYLPSKEIKNSLISMAILQDGLVILANWEDHLLPIVHQLWHPLVNRFSHHNVLLINRAWQLLCTLAYVSKDFIRSRTLQQVLPAISKFLGDSAKESYKKNSHVYEFTQVYKLQKELLSGLGNMAKELKLHERELWKILSIAEPYLHSNQNVSLQKCCIKMYKDIADFNEDIVWVKCLSTWHSKVGHILSNANFSINSLMIANTSSNNYLDNIQIIIAYIEHKSIINSGK